MKKTKIIMIVVIGCLLLCLAALCGVYVINKGQEDKTYISYIEKGEKYLAELAYDDAVVYFKLAIEEDEENADAYIGLARAYEGRQDYMMARETLEQGLMITSSTSIERELAQLVERYYLSNGELRKNGSMEEAAKELTGDDKNTTLDVSFLLKLASYQNDDYRREFGSYASKEKNGAALVVRYQRFDAVLTYENMKDEELSLDTNGAPVSDAVPTKISLDDIGILFQNFTGKISFDKLQEMISTKIEMKKDEALEKNLLCFYYKNCSFRIESDANGNIVSETPWNEIIPNRPGQKPEESEQQTLVYQSVVIDAVTGRGLADVTVTFTPENRKQKAVTETTANDGSYEAELCVGERYEVKFEKEGYIAESVLVEATGEAGDIVIGEQVSISPELMQGEIRIVLTWGATPRDLDSHLDGRTADGTSVSISFRNRRKTVNGELAAELDVDDTSSYGPETTTIYQDGEYYFSVYNYSQDGSEAMTNSEAEVKVYLPGESAPQVFTIPEGEGEWWNVFKISNGTVTPINERSDEQKTS